jgi:hypothetical protein
MKKLITPKELADRWAMSADTLKKWRCIKRGPPFVKLGGKKNTGRDNIRYRLEDIEKYENGNEVGSWKRK